uniref:Uncharacterized protein n=1 Tax=Anopheles atroparvus TaxID=41427 RepID=A0AAG5DX47_ANOAO
MSNVLFRDGQNNDVRTFCGKEIEFIGFILPLACGSYFRSTCF